MEGRRILVIGSQCDALPNLSFLPRAAESLYDAMVEPDLGACEPALEKTGLLLNPSVEACRHALNEAFERADHDEATLFLAFVGHGEMIEGDFYLLPLDAPLPPNSDRSIHLSQKIKELRGRFSRI